MSFGFKDNFDDFFKVFANLINFHDKMNIGNEEDFNKKLQKFKFYITDLNKNDKINFNLIKKIETKINLVKKNFVNLPVTQRVNILNHYLELLNKVKNYNEKIITTKNKIVDEYKKFSFDSITNIIKNFHQSNQKKPKQKFRKIQQNQKHKKHIKKF